MPQAPIDGLLKQEAHGFVARLENGRAHQDLHLAHALAGRRLGSKVYDQVLDLGFAGDGDLGIGRFFLSPAFRSWRVCSVRVVSYSLTRDLK